MLEIRGNEIAHTGTGSGGFQTGIKVSIEPDGEAIQTVNKTEFDLIANTIRDCLATGIHLQSDRLSEDASEHMATFQFDRNTITGCAGPGVHIDRGDDEGGYLNVEMYGNLIVDNQLGILVSGNDTDAPWAMAGCTIVDNSSFGLAIDDLIGHVPSSLVNCIVYSNNGNGSGEQGGTSGFGSTVVWDTDDVTVFEHNNWELLFSSCSCTPDADGNVDDSPGFVNQASGDYHLTSTACSRNKGDNTPTAGPQLTELDIDGEPRVYRADGVNQVDQGADEYSGS